MTVAKRGVYRLHWDFGQEGHLDGVFVSDGATERKF